MIHWLIAFVCAVEPCAFNVPLEHAIELALEELDEDEEFELPLEDLELEQAASVTAAAASPATAPIRYSFTVVPFVIDSVNGDAKRDRWRRGGVKMNAR